MIRIFHNYLNLIILLQKRLIYYFLHAKEISRSLNRLPFGNLRYHETSGGHSIEQHVKISIDQLKNRIVNNRISVSRFWDNNAARGSIQYIINQNQEKIYNWLLSGGDRRSLKEQIPISGVVGFGFKLGSEKTGTGLKFHAISYNIFDIT